jgi:hypothetical protein
VRASEIEVDGVYLTRGIEVAGLFGPKTTRGSVRVLERRQSGALHVQWLMADGSPRTGLGLPSVLKPRDLVARVS